MNLNWNLLSSIYRSNYNRHERLTPVLVIILRIWLWAHRCRRCTCREILACCDTQASIERWGAVLHWLGEGSIFVFSYEHHVWIDSFDYTLSDVIHSLHPLHLIGGFELFGDAFFFGVFFYKPRKEFLRLFLDVCKRRMEFAGSEQVVIQDFTVVL